MVAASWRSDCVKLALVHGPNGHLMLEVAAFRELGRRASARLVGCDCLPTGRVRDRRSKRLVHGPLAPGVANLPPAIN